MSRTTGCGADNVYSTKRLGSLLGGGGRLRLYMLFTGFSKTVISKTATLKVTTKSRPCRGTSVAYEQEQG